MSRANADAASDLADRPDVRPDRVHGTNRPPTGTPVTPNWKQTRILGRYTLYRDEGFHGFARAPAGAEIVAMGDDRTDEDLFLALPKSAATIAVGAPGQVAKLTFTATAGEKVFLDILSSTVPYGCGTISIAHADGSTLALGCRPGHPQPGIGAYSRSSGNRTIYLADHAS